MTNTIYSDGEYTRFIFRHSGGSYSGKTHKSVLEVISVIKGVELPTSRQRALERFRRVTA